MDPRLLSISDYTYELPVDKIASKPSEERGESKLLIWKDGVIQEDNYKNIAQHFTADSLLVFNDTKVIPARILFKKNTGSIIEIFCLETIGAEAGHMGLGAKDTCTWKCFVGGMSKWKDNYLEKIIIVEGNSVKLFARVIEKQEDAYLIEFSWNDGYTFEQIINSAGAVPLPPYIKRESEEVDKTRYQTVFARSNGSVAAPTAALHFTNSIIKSLEAKNLLIEYVTLHVGAGTFKPVKALKMADHDMHSEWIDVTLRALNSFLTHGDKPFISVGTTSARTLESLYWMGVKIIKTPHIETKQLSIKQWEVYELLQEEKKYTRHEALHALAEWIKEKKSESIFVPTQIIIAPGYKFKMVDILVTNFHQPQSTLLLLVGAAIGKDWERVYDYALKNDFRFLSYGDGCLLHLKQY